MKQQGFTLIEIMVTLTLLGILALAVVPLSQMSVKRQQESELRHALREIRDALDAWKKAVDEGRIASSAALSGYPPSLESLVEGKEDLQHPGRRKLFFLRRIPRNPFSEAAQPAASTWGLRSYASEANDPKPGEDVYDIYPLNSGNGLNGIPYRDW